MTVDDPHGEPLLRGALGVIVVADLVSFFFFIANARAIAPASAFTNVSDVFSRMPVVGAVVSIGVAGAVAFAWRPGRIWEGLVSLGALTLLSTAHAQLYGSPWRHLYYSGLCLSGWLLGLGLGRHRGAATDESLARIGSIALLGAAYLNAGISKLAFGGIDWLSGLPIQAVVVGQDGLVADSILSSYRTWVAETPAAASLFAIATVGFELAGPLMIAGRKTRLCVALGLLAMHANIYVLTRILYWESMVLLVLLGFSADPPETPAMAISSDSSDRRYTIAVTVLALCAFFAVIHQSHRFTQSHETKPVTGPGMVGTGPSMATAASAPTAVTRQVGPLVVGETLPEGWSVDTLDVTTDGFIVGLSASAGRVTFEVTCAASEHRSPFDLGAAHIFHSNGLDSRNLQAVGSAVQEKVRRAADGRDICEEVARWRTSAR